SCRRGDAAEPGRERYPAASGGDPEPPRRRACRIRRGATASRMRTLLSLLGFAAAAISTPAAAQEAAGDWIGTLDAGGTRLRIAVHIEQREDGTLGGTLDSLDQGAFGLALPGVTL